MSKPTFAIGIDFGTTFCCVAILRHPTKKPEVIPSNYSTNTTPSYVAYNADSDSDDENSDEEDGPFFAGEAAKQEAHENPEKTFFDIKRLIGRSFYDPHIQKYKQLWPFHLVTMVGQVGVKIDDQNKLPQEIALELIRHLKKTSEDYLGGPIDSAVVTVPVYYNQMQRDLTRGAAEAAGFKSIHFIPEPVAAAVAYGLKSSIRNHETKTCLIYDLGGGTFDVTVFRLDSSNRVEILATGGDDRLGGEDFNDLITEFCIDEFKNLHEVDLTEGKTSDDAEACKKTAKKLRRIRNECEKQKCYLGSLTSVVVSLDNIHGNFNLLFIVTRSKFEDLISPLLARSMKILEKTIKESGFQKEEINDVILIGGSSRIPKVTEIVQEYFEGKQILRTIDADEAVACGAAVHAYNVFKENAAPFSMVTLNLNEAKENKQQSATSSCSSGIPENPLLPPDVVASLAKFEANALEIIQEILKNRTQKFEKYVEENSLSADKFIESLPTRPNPVLPAVDYSSYSYRGVASVQLKDMAEKIERLKGRIESYRLNRDGKSGKDRDVIHEQLSEACVKYSKQLNLVNVIGWEELRNKQTGMRLALDQLLTDLGEQSGSSMQSGRSPNAGKSRVAVLHPLLNAKWPVSNLIQFEQDWIPATLRLVKDRERPLYFYLRLENGHFASTVTICRFKKIG